MKYNKSKYIFNGAVVVVLLCAVIFARIIPHFPNSTPLTSIMMFFSMVFCFNNKNIKSNLALLYIIVPISGLLISDIFLAHYAFSSMLITYIGWIFVFGLGFLIRKISNTQKFSVLKVYGGTLGGSLVFYLFTNCVWLYNAPPVMYPHNIAGQISSYTMALPFLRNQLLGDLVYATVIFGAYYFAEKIRIKVFEKTPLQVQE